MEREKVHLPVFVNWILGISVAAVIIFPTLLCYRWTYTHTKRYRVVVPGKVYRSGRMLGQGFDEMLKRDKIRTVINLMDEELDPQLQWTYFSSHSVPESEICRENAAKYITLAVDTIHPSLTPANRPHTIDHFLEIMDNPANYPVLLHCRAGLHRTGILTAVYRMEYEGWTPTQAWDEMRQNGFGEDNCYADNEYVRQYIFTYKPGWRRMPGTEENNTDAPTPLDSLIRRAKFHQK